MAYILNIETSTTVCSVSISKNTEVIALEEINNGYTHAENLHVFIDMALKSAGISLSQLNAVAVSKGPGSYTGLRIGVSAAKGLAFGLKIPLIALNTLQVMASQVRSINNNCTSYCSMLDARRMELYTAVYDAQLNELVATQALVINELSASQYSKFDRICFFGDGMQKAIPFLNTIKNVIFIDNIMPSAKFMCELSYQKFSNNEFENVAYFEPFYLKDFFISTPKRT